MDLKLTPEAAAAYQTFIGWYPPILRAERTARIDWLLGLMLNVAGTDTASPEMVVEAATFIARPAWGSRLSRLRGAAETPRREAKIPYQSLEGNRATQRFIKRWPSVPGKPAKPAADLKVLAVCGSSRHGGNTDAMIDAACNGAAEAGAQVMDKVYLGDLNICPCENAYMQRDVFGAREVERTLDPEFCARSRGLVGPQRRGGCTLVDDMPEVYAKIVAADAIILGFRVINGWEGDLVTAFQERWQRYEACLIDAKIGPGRRAMVIGTWGTNDLSAYADVIGIVITRLGIRGFPVTEALAGCGFSGILSGLDEHGKGVILEFPEELEKARQAGVNLATGGCPEPVAD